MGNGNAARAAVTVTKRLDTANGPRTEPGTAATVASGFPEPGRRIPWWAAGRRRTGARGAVQGPGISPYPTTWAQAPVPSVRPALRAVLSWAHDAGQSPKIATTRRGMGNG